MTYLFLMMMNNNKKVKFNQIQNQIQPWQTWMVLVKNQLTTSNSSSDDAGSW